MSRFFTFTTVGLLALGTVFGSGEVATAVSFGPSSEEKSLQELLDAITVDGPKIDTVNAQTGFDLFTNTASSGSVATFMFELTSKASISKFGIYNQSGVKAQLFGGSNDVSDGATVNFLGNGNVTISTIGFPPGNAPSPSITTYTGFGNVFGFYIETEQETFYTQNSRNPNGSQQAVIYQGNNQTTLQIQGRQPGVFTDNEFIIAFEDLLRSIPGNSDSDFQDLVVLVESIKPTSAIAIPEPGTANTLLAFGLGSFALMLKGQRRKLES
ncbi:DUF4114 domain-containing protein [Phormidium sp. LEGE 05292]|uniref:DUF4114 domain-containing protein n=1 Tax=[Phormidium] sp. LEGE 05292 TaxID=767427 RepID=UPI00187F896D|nr:DUF4114 domain-containing protein [Phormidium sp. LEGE 05292]MBE9226802.1 DUF4114 domain-containing protein [Phormidium sp. LEGE 05292]